MKAIRLLQTAMIAGKPRSPVEGIQTVTEAEAKRLIEEGQAEDASGDVDIDAGDGLDKMTVKRLRALAKKEGASIEGDANKATILAAIRQHREEGGDDDDLDDLDDLDVVALRTLAAEEEVEVAEGDDLDAMRAAIRTKRAATTK